jgi:DNA-binding LacI/PurR family transcriptional regulator
MLPDLRHAFADAYFGELLSGVSQSAHAAGWKLLLEQAGSDYLARGKHVELYEQRYVDGVILLGTSDAHNYAPQLAEAGCPAVVLDNRLDCGGGGICDHVICDYTGGAKQAMNYLRQLGHEKIGLLTAAPDIATSRDIAEVWHTELVGDPTDLLQDGRFTEAGGAEAMAAMLSKRPDVTAVLATNDKMAIGALHWLSRQGIDVPTRMSLIGFDDLQTSAFVTPSLTTIHLPLYEVGARATELLLDRLRQDNPAPLSEVLPTHLVVRNSTGMGR